MKNNDACRVTGIIAEYNPFHNGHAYHIQKARECTGAEYVIAVMSPDFVQRAEAAVLDKYTRAQMALLGGADVVLELPVCFATGSAWYFAQGAMRILDLCGCIQTLCFGCETPDIQLLWKIAGVIRSEPPAYRSALRAGLAAGQTFPAARTRAVLSAFAGHGGTLDEYRIADPEEITATLKAPNNILALEYLKALQQRDASILPVAIKREGSAYHAALPEQSSPYASAAALRALLTQGQRDELRPWIPAPSFAVLQRALSGSFDGANTGNQIADLYADFDRLLRFRWLQAASGSRFEGDPAQAFLPYLDVDEALANRMANKASDLPDTPLGLNALADLLWTKDITRGRALRSLTHLLLDIKSADTDLLCSSDSYAYAQVLGFRREASFLLRRIQENGRLKLITKPADAPKVLSGPALHSFARDMAASNCYQLLRQSSSPSGSASRNAYRQGPVIIN